MNLRYKLTAYAPNGDRLGELPAPSTFQMASPLNDLPSLTLGYHRDAPQSELLDEPIEVAVLLSGPDEDVFNEYTGMRFLRLRQAKNLADRADISTFTMPSYAWQFKKVRNIRYTHFSENGKREFSNVTAGTILLSFISEARDRGNIPGLDTTFTSSVDSSGAAWNRQLTMGFDGGQDLYTTLLHLADQGIIDWSITRRQLSVYNVDGGLKRDMTASVNLLYGHDLTASPDDASYEELAGRVLVQGDNGIYLDLPNSGAVSPWGLWENYLTQGGVSDVATMQILAQASLDKTSDQRVQMTREIAFPTTALMPYRDYRVGDQILAPGADGSPTSLRIRQITLTAAEGNRVSGNLVLNDRFIERDLRMDRQIAGITGGAGIPGGSGGIPAPEGDDTRTPAAPLDLVLGTVTYVDALGRPRAQINAAWSPVDTAADGSDMSIRRYSVEMRVNELGAIWQETTSTTHPDTTATMGPVDIDVSYAVRIRAIGHNNVYSAPSAVETILTQPDSTPPPVPSDPTTGVSLGVISVAWDGLAFNGTAMPADFDHVNVYMSPGGLAEWALVGTLYREGSLIVTGQPYNEARDFHLTAVDNSTNESDPSGTASATPVPLVPDDILEPGSIGYELLADNAVRDRVLQDGAVSSSKIATGAVIADKVNARAITAEKLAIGGFANNLVDPGLDDAAVNLARQPVASTGTSNGWTGTYGYTFPVGRNGYQIEKTGTSPGSGTLAWVMPLQTGADPTPTTLISLQASNPDNFYAVDDLTEVTYRCQVYRADYSAASTITMRVVWYYRREDDTRGTANAPFVNYPGPGVGAVDVSTYTYVLSIEDINASDPDNPVTHIMPVMWAQLSLAANPGMETGAQFGIYDFELPMFGFGSTLIQNGSVTTGKIAANAITADNLMVGSVTAGAIAADAVTATQLYSDAITAKHTITGAVFQTTATANRGIKINSTGLNAYSNSGVNTVSIDSATGTMVGTGTFQSGTSGQRTVVSSGVYANRPGIQFHTGISSYDLQPCIFSEASTDPGTYGLGALVLLSAETTINDSGRTSLSLRPGSSGFSLRREYLNDTMVGIDLSSLTLRFWGRLQSNPGQYEMFRGGRFVNPGGTTGGSLSHTTADTSPRVLLTPGDSNPKYLAVTAYSASGFSWTANAATSAIVWFSFMGGS